jgi:plasmid stabilization system protein ParE
MSRKKSRPADVRLTQRALNDIRGIKTYSVERWGARVAAKYIGEFEAALGRLAQRPELTQGEPDFHAALRFYRAGSHLFVCDVRDDRVLVLTVVHAAMDLPTRLAEFQPQLAIEAKLLEEQLARRAKRRKRPE